MQNAALHVHFLFFLLLLILDWAVTDAVPDAVRTHESVGHVNSLLRSPNQKIITEATSIMRVNR